MVETVIVTGQATYDALSGYAGTSNTLTLSNNRPLDEVLSAKVISRYDASGTVTTVVSGVYGVTSGVFHIANLYPEKTLANLGSGTITSGQIAVASDNSVQIATYSGMADTIGTNIKADHLVVLRVASKGDLVRT